MRWLRSSSQNLPRAAACLFFAAATFLLGHDALAATQTGPGFVVNSLADSNDGACDLLGQGTGNNDCTLREAINAANVIADGATITFTLSGTIILSSQLPAVNRSMTIDGTGQSVEISGNDSVNIFIIFNNFKTLNLNALTISHARNNQFGGLFLRYASANITNCTFNDNYNTGSLGGAIWGNEASNVVVANSTFYNNKAQYAAGIHIAGVPNGAPSSLKVYNCTFFNNQITAGGLTLRAVDINADSATAEVRNSVLVTDATPGHAIWVNCQGITAGSDNIDNRGFCGENSNPSAAQINLDALKDNGGPTKTVALLPGSVAINAGNNTFGNAAPVNNLDQRGYDRIRPGDPTGDVGAYEFGSNGSLLVNTSSEIASSAYRQNSLRTALAYAQSLGGAQTITFSPALAGQTITLNTGWNDANDTAALRVSGQVAVQGLTSSPGVTIAIAQSVQKRHFYIESPGNLTLANLTLSNGNVSDYGGSIWNAGTLTVRGCTFTGNSAGNQGGAIQSNLGTVLSVENTTISGNTAGSVASAIATGAQQTTLRYLTVSNNTGGGGAILLYQYPTTMIDSIVAGNSPDGIIAQNGGAFAAQSTNNILGSGGTGGLTDGVNGNRTGVPIAQLNLGPLANNGGPTATFALQGGSLAIDAGVDIAGLTTDQRGMARPQLHAPDVGAYELVPGAGSLVVTSVTDEKNGTSDPAFGSGTSLREALLYAQSLGGAQTITFAPALAGQTVTLSTGWNDASDANALRISGQTTLQGLPTAPGVTIAMAQGVQKRHILVESTGNLAVSHLTFSGGAGPDYGGAIWSFGSLTVRNCTFTGNTAGAEGGAIQSWGDSPSLLIENSTFTGNQSNGIAGAIVGGAVSMTFRYVTISNNTAADGNAVVIYKYALTMVDSIIAGTGSEGVGSVNGGTFSAASTNNILGSATAAGLTNGVNNNQLGVPVNQLWLGSLGNTGGPTATIALQPGSLAIDAGVAIDGLASDQRGTERPQQGASDVGAFELVQLPAAAPIQMPQDPTFERIGQVAIMTTSPNTLIRYTIGSEPPTPTTGQLYTGPLTIYDNVSIQAIAYGRGWIPSQVTVSNTTIYEPLEYWRAVVHGLETEEQDFENPSGDGIVNLLKYAFNLAPNTGDLAKPNYQVLTPDGTAGLPSITRDGQGRLVLQFIRRKAAANPGVAYIPETGTDLLTWSPLELTNATVVPLGSVWERVTVVDPAISARRFGRVRVTTVGVYYNDFEFGDDRTNFSGSATLVNGAAQLTDGSTSGQEGSIVLRGIEVGPELTGFTARFNLALGPSDTATPGDGLSFAVGTLPATWGETGPGAGHSLAVGFDTFENGGTGSKGIHVWVNGVHLAASPVDPYTNGAVVPVEITFEANSALTVKFNGATIFEHLPISGFFIDARSEELPEDEFGFGARTGSAVQRAVVDEVQIEPLL